MDKEPEKSSQVLKKLKEKEIDIDIITQKLEDEGIEKFNKAWAKLMEAVEKEKNT